MISTAKPDQLLSPDFMARLDPLALVSRKILLGRMRGERLSKRKGQSVGFLDFLRPVLTLPSPLPARYKRIRIRRAGKGAKEP